MADAFGCTGWAVAAGSAGTLFGYYVRYALAQRNAARKEDWDRLRDFSSHVNDLVSEAIEFFCAPSADSTERHKKAIRIQRLISVSGQKASSIARSLGDSSVLSFQKRLRQSITLDDFDTDVSRPPCNQSDERIQAIENACYSLIGVLDSAYMKRYRCASSPAA